MYDLDNTVFVWKEYEISFSAVKDDCKNHKIDLTMSNWFDTIIYKGNPQNVSVNEALLNIYLFLQNKKRYFGVYSISANIVTPNSFETRNLIKSSYFDKESFEIQEVNLKQPTLLALKNDGVAIDLSVLKI